MSVLLESGCEERKNDGVHKAWMIPGISAKGGDRVRFVVLNIERERVRTSEQSEDDIDEQICEGE